MRRSPTGRCATALFLFISVRYTVSLQASDTTGKASGVVVASSGKLRNDQAGGGKALLRAEEAKIQLHMHQQDEAADDASRKSSVAATTTTCPPADASLVTTADLQAQSCNIFPSGNLNAASFKWIAAMLDRGVDYPTFLQLNTGFCPISGEPINGGKTVRVSLRNVTVDAADSQPYISEDVAQDGAHAPLSRVLGRMYYDDTDVICDLLDRVYVDSYNAHCSDGEVSLTVLVIGDPCLRAQVFSSVAFVDPHTGNTTNFIESAPEVRCNETAETLKGALYSNNGYPIIGNFYPDHEFHLPPTEDADDPKWVQDCDDMKRDHGQTGSADKGFYLRTLTDVSPVPDIQHEVYLRNSRPSHVSQPSVDDSKSDDHTPTVGDGDGGDDDDGDGDGD